MKGGLLRLLASSTLLAVPLAALATGSGAAAGRAPHLTAAAIGPYRMASEAQEIALARSAAPSSIASHATVMVLDLHGYTVAVQGSNGFVCLVARSWDNTVEVADTRFWDPTFRAPYCFNPAGARSVLARYLMRTQWVLAGASEHELGELVHAAWAAGKIAPPLPGAMSYMMSRNGRKIGGESGPWRPHLMFYFPRAETPDWGANLPGSPVFAAAYGDTTIFYVPVPAWSDDSPAPAHRHEPPNRRR